MACISVVWSEESSLSQWNVVTVIPAHLCHKKLQLWWRNQGHIALAAFLTINTFHTQDVSSLDIPTILPHHCRTTPVTSLSVITFSSRLCTNISSHTHVTCHRLFYLQIHIFWGKRRPTFRHLRNVGYHCTKSTRYNTPKYFNPHQTASSCAGVV